MTLPTATGASIDVSKVTAFSAAMTALATINVPTLGADGSLSTTATLDTHSTAETEIVTLETDVAASSTALGTSVTTVTPPSTTVLSGVDKAKAFFSDLRTNLHLFANSAKTGLLNLQGTRIQTDMTNEIGPDITNATNRLHHMMKGADMLSNGSTPGATRAGGSFPNDFLCTLTDATHVTCLSRSGYAFTGPTNYLRVVITARGTPTPSATTATYAATAMTCTADGTGGTAIGGTGGWPGCSDAPGSARTDKATGAGTLSYATDVTGNLTSLTINNGTSGTFGTFPGSNTGVVQDSVALTGSVTGPATGSQRLDISGSVNSYGGTGTTPDTTAPMVTLAIGSGSYATDQQVVHTQFLTGYSCSGSSCTPIYTPCVTTTTYSCTWGEPSAVNVTLVANTPNTKFTGTLTMGNAMFDASGTKWIPTTATFIGTIADTSSGGAGTFLTGELDLAASNYATIYAPQQGSGNNLLATAKFTGTLAFPNEPTMSLVLSGSKTGVNTGTTSITFSYGNGKTISVVSAPITSTSTTNSITLANQDSIKLTLVEGVHSVNVTVGSDIVATVSNNMINYSDGYVESTN